MARKPRTLRQAFVVTLAATIDGGCGNAVGACDGGVCAPTDTPVQNGACPAATPGFSASCSQEGLACTYTVGATDPCGPRPTMFYCSAGRWTGGISTCNPPAPSRCAVTPPMDAESCYPNLAGAPTHCDYDGCGAGGVVAAECRSTGGFTGQWQLTRGTCNPLDGGPTDAAVDAAPSPDGGGG